jgi:hypothetical protein
MTYEEAFERVVEAAWAHVRTLATSVDPVAADVLTAALITVEESR